MIKPKPKPPEAAETTGPTVFRHNAGRQTRLQRFRKKTPPDSAADKLAAAQAERKKLMEQAASCLKGRTRITPEEEADDGYINVKI